MADTAIIFEKEIALLFDTSRLVPEARSIVEAVAAIYVRHTQPWLVGLVVHGSALKGGFIPGCSDIDFQLFLDEQAFRIPHELPFETGLAIQRDLAQINPAPFRYIQGKAFSAVLPPDHTGPVPGAYLLLAGKLPVAEATKSQLQESARRRIARLKPLPPYLVGSLLEHGKGRLAWHIRWLCTDVWPTVYQVLVLQGHDPFSIWSLSKAQAIALLPPETPLGQTSRAFYQAVQTYYPSEEVVGEGLAVIITGVAFLHTVQSWWQAHKYDGESLSHNS
jgi:hypothetical protein